MIKSICKTVWVVGMLLAGANGYTGSTAEYIKAKHEFPVMGTWASFTFTSAPQKNQDLFAAAEKEFRTVCSLASVHDLQSELNMLNRSAANKPFRCSDRLYDLLLIARRAYYESNGAFDATAKPLMDLWGFYRKKRQSMPDKEEIIKALDKVGLNKIKFNNQEKSVYFTVKGMSLDLGGIAKGYAIDSAYNAVKSELYCGIIDLGGNLKVANPPGVFSRVAIRHPLYAGKFDRILPVGNSAVSTSGGYEKFVIYNNKRYCHIIDPVSGYPAEGILAVTVFTPSAADSDWMSTAVFLRGKSLAEKLVKKYPATTIYIYYELPENSYRCEVIK